MADTKEKDDWLARLHLPNGVVLTLQPDLRWISSEGGDFWATTANYYSSDYEYSVAHGARGAMLAHGVAYRLGGTVELPPQKDEGEPPRGVVI